jgi:hypothetical protein
MPAFNSRVRVATIFGMPDNAFYAMLMGLMLIMMAIIVNETSPPVMVIFLGMMSLTLFSVALVTFINRDRLLLMPSVGASKTDLHSVSFLAVVDE